MVCVIETSVALLLGEALSVFGSGSAIGACHRMKSLCAAVHVSEKKVFPHNLRHLFARTFYERQKDIVRLADLLGHSSVETTRIYTACSDEVCRRQLRGLGLLWGQGSTAT